MTYTPELSESSVSRMITELTRERATHNARLHVRRLLLDMGVEATTNNFTGTNIPAPFDKSSLIIKTVTGDAVQTVQHYATRFKANPPIPLRDPDACVQAVADQEDAGCRR